ncbi:MAG: leucine-rich repeat protein [Oscillospiraceae bacterium]|nr:leucine-rich repeat protein [Oscillospiraceae bacterium]
MKQKKIAGVVLASCMAVSSGLQPLAPLAEKISFSMSTISAGAVSSADDFSFDAETGTIISYNGSDDDVDIPSEIDGVAVKSIGDSAFAGCISLTSVTIPDGVTSIGSSAFSCCNGLTSVTIPDGVTSIGFGTFNECNSLTEITIPDSVTSIGAHAFFGTGLTSITIPDSVISIGEGAFYYTPWLFAKREENPLVIVSSIVIDGSACEGDVVIPDSVTSIGERAFYYCEGLTSITIPDSVTSIGGYAFYECTSLTEITIPDSVTSIGYNAFYRCKSLTDITILNPACEIAYGIPDNVLIHGYTGSTAEAYAEEYERTFVSLGESPVKELALGDINGDGIIGADDAQAVLQAYVNTISDLEDGLTDAQRKAADINKDGTVSGDDAQLILQYYAYTLSDKEVTWEELLK